MQHALKRHVSSLMKHAPRALCTDQRAHGLLHASLMMEQQAFTTSPTVPPGRFQVFNRYATSAHAHRQAPRLPEDDGQTARGLRAMDDLERLEGVNEFHPTFRSKLEEAKEALQLALARDSSDLRAMVALARLHLSYNGNGLSPHSGEALLVQAADAGLADAQYELACWLRSQASSAEEEQQEEDRQRGSSAARATQYLVAAAQQVGDLDARGHADALFLLGVARYAGDTMARDVAAARRCFAAAANKGNGPFLSLMVALLSLVCLAAALLALLRDKAKACLALGKGSSLDPGRTWRLDFAAAADRVAADRVTACPVSHSHHREQSSQDEHRES
eukprot:jgi/Mesen1/8543/ME000484S07936